MTKVTKIFAAIFLFLLICNIFPITDIINHAPVQNLQEPSHPINASTENMAVLWNKTWGNANNDQCWAVAQGPAESIYCVGRYQDSYTTSNTVLMKYFSNGTQAWVTTWGEAHDETCLRITLDLGGNIYCAGETGDFGQGNWDFLLLKYYANGTFAWSTTWGGSGYVTRRDNARGVAVDAAGNIYCAGFTQCFGAGGYDFALVKFYSNSTLAWYQTWGGSGDDACNQMTIDSAGNLYCVGYTYNFGVVNRDLALVKFYPNGTRAWNTTWGGTQNDEAQGVVLDTVGNIYCTGFTNSFGLGLNALALVKFYPNGTRAWNTTWGGSNEDWGYSIALGNEGDLYCLGTTQSYGVGLQDFALVKFNPGGNKLWNATWGSSNQDDGRGIILDASNDIYCVGSTQSYGAGGWDFAVVKIDNAPPTYSSVMESADPLELGNSEIITITGVMDPSGVQTVRIFFEGTNHTMTNLGGGTWRYSGWAPSNIGNYSYSIYMQDNLGKWNVISGVILVTLTVVPENSDPTQDEWPMFRGQLNHTGEAHTTPINHSGPFWSYFTGGAISSSAAVMEGRIYVGSSDSKVYCLNATSGGLLWNYTTGSWVESSPAVAGGRVYVGSGDGRVYCLNAYNGRLIWNYTTGDSIHSSPAVAGGCVYIGSRDYNIYCLNATTGKLLWNYLTGYWVEASPAVANGRVYVSSWDWNVYCLNASTGGFLWNYPNTLSSLAVADGRVCGGSYDGSIYCLNETTGSFLWSFPTGNYLESSPAIVGGRVTVGSYDGSIYCLNATSGGLLWSYFTGTGVYSSPAVAGERVYIGSDGGTVYCLNATTGKFLCCYAMASYVSSSPAVAGGRVYINSGDGTIYCLPCIVDPKPPTFTSVIESADPLELGGTETITITGVTALFGVKEVLIAFEGTNHTMTNLGGGIWHYNTWTPSTLSNYSYTIYIKDIVENCNATSDVIHLVNPTIPTYTFVTESADPLALGSAETITIFGVADIYGIQRVLLEFDGSNHTMSDLGNGTWCYTTWVPSSMGTYSYMIYIQDKSGNWNATSGSIKVLFDNRSILWIAQWGGTDTERGIGVVSDTAGNSYCAGFTDSFGAGNYDFVLIKFYPNGTRAWNTTWGGSKSDQCQGIARDKVGNLYCVGQTNGFGAGNYDLVLVKFYPNGTRAWNTTWGGPNYDMGAGVAVDSAGNLYCVGCTFSSGVGGDLALVKFYPNGTRAWNTTWGGSNGDVGSGIVLDTQGNLYCIGYTDGYGAGNNDFALVKFYPNGTRAWNTTWGGSDSDAGSGIVLDTQSNLYCVGQTWSFGAGGRDLALVKFYPNGTRAWNTTWGGSGWDQGYNIGLDTQGNLYCGGVYNDYVSHYVGAVIKFYPNGTQAWNIIWDSYFEVICGLTLDSAGGIFCAGWQWISEVNDQLVLIKFGDSEPPTITVNTPNGGTYTSAPTLGIDFSDSFSLDAGYYKVDSYTPTGTSTTGWIQIFANHAGKCYTSNFMMNTTLWNSLSQGSHIVYFKAWDDAGNTNDGASPSWQFSKDSKAPTYTSVSESADPLELGGTEMITIAGVTDLSGIKAVLLEFEGNNHTLTNSGGGIWYYNNWTPSIIATNSYTIYIQDNPGNWNGTSSSIQVANSSPPTYISVIESADPLELGITETIMITGVADLSGIQTVLLEFEEDNQTMTNLGGGTWYYNALTPTSTGSYPYRIFIQDNLGNWNMTSSTIQVVDTTPPTYISVIESADPLELGGTETIAIAGVADLSGINQVLLELGGFNQTMANLGSGTWRYNTWSPDSIGICFYEIFLQDNAGNWKATNGSIQVVDTTLPRYTSIIVRAGMLELGDTETITITDLADLSGIQTVQLQFEGSNHTLTNLGGGLWTYNNWTPSSVDVFSYWIYIQDNAGNCKAISSEIQVISVTLPTYTSITESADLLELGNPETILISGVADFSGIQTVKISFEGSNHTMTNLGGSDTWCYLGWTPNNTGTYLYTIYIQDNLGNWNAVSGSIQVSAITTAPSLDWLMWLLALIAIGAVFCAIVLYARLNKKIQKLSSPKAFPPKALPKKMESQ